MEDFTGRKFGRWTVLSFSHKVSCGNGANYYWNCICDCGTVKKVSASSLRGGKSTSCGCYNKEIISQPKKHGMTKEKIYWVWHSMIQRCENKNEKNYRNYGGRGIKVCPEWHDSGVFIEWSLSNGYKQGLTLDRIDSNGNYEPNNCRWVGWDVQANNTCRNHYVEINGIVKTVAQWARENNIPYKSVYSRTRDLGWSFEKALTTPIRKQKKRGA